jgi:hypothetical protein
VDFISFWIGPDQPDRAARFIDGQTGLVPDLMADPETGARQVQLPVKEKKRAQ